MAKTPKTNVVEVEVNVDEIRAQLGDAMKTVKVELGISTINDTLDGFIETVRAAAEEAGMIDFRMSHRPSGYSYAKGSWNQAVMLTGKRPYTDDEIRKSGPSLLAQKVRNEKAQAKAYAKKLAAMNKIARELGLPEVTEIPND